MLLLSFQVLPMDNDLERPLVALTLVAHEAQAKYQPLQDREEHHHRHMITTAPSSALKEFTFYRGSLNYLFPPYQMLIKVGCVFPMIISSDFYMERHRDDDYKEYTPHFKLSFSRLRDAIFPDIERHKIT